MKHLLYLLLLCSGVGLAQGPTFSRFNQNGVRASYVRGDSAIMLPSLNYFPTLPANFDYIGRQFSTKGAAMIYTNPTDSTVANWPYWYNGTRWFTIAPGSTTNIVTDTSVLEYVLDSIGQLQGRVLYSGPNRKLTSSPYFLYDQANRKLVLNNLNVSIGGPQYRLYVNGKSHTSGLHLDNMTNYIGAPQDDTKVPLAWDTNGDVVVYTAWPKVLAFENNISGDSIILLFSNGDRFAVPRPVGSGGGITDLTGDVTATGPGSAAATLATVNANVGSFTNANITVNAKGLITAASNGSGGGGITGSGAAGQVTYWTGPTAITGSSSFTWDNTVRKLSATSSLTTPGAAMLEFTNTSANGLAFFRGVNDLGNGIGLSVTGSNYVTAYDAQNLAVLSATGSARALRITSNGDIENGGTMPIVMQPGGFNTFAMANFHKDYVRLGRVGVEATQLTVNTSGFVGIGTYTPAYPLNIKYNSTGIAAGVQVENANSGNYANYETKNNGTDVGGFATYGNAHANLLLRSNTALYSTTNVLLMGNAGGFVPETSTYISFRPGGFAANNEVLRVHKAGMTLMTAGEGAATNASAILDIQSTDKGVLFPRLTQVQRNAISGPANGLTIYCTDCLDSGGVNAGVIQTYQTSTTTWRNHF